MKIAFPHCGVRTAHRGCIFLCGESLSDWQDIATAPKDVAILVFGKPSDLMVGTQKLLHFKRAGIHLASWDEIDQAFCLDGGSWLGPFIKPTHWRPLPDPPVSK